MAEIMLNSQKIIQSFPPDITLKDLVVGVASNLLNPSDTITNVYINNKPVDNPDDSFHLQISNFSNINFEVKNIHQLAFEALQTLSTHLGNTIDKILIITPYFRKGKIAEGMQKYCQLIEFIDLFIRSVQDIMNSLDDILTNEIKSEIDTLEKETLKYFQKILTSQEKGDHVHLADLLEYELTHCLNEWKQDIIPKLNKLS